ncbi:hypothetical protein Sjap_024116 [Stephania japonica]|uniref:Uncharacterized protein n=1 Tax=Stephania japonica TaxID=461633 RepID=A0AAP0ELH5_9MAGN
MHLRYQLDGVSLGFGLVVRVRLEKGVTGVCMSGVTVSCNSRLIPKAEEKFPKDIDLIVACCVECKDKTKDNMMNKDADLKASAASTKSDSKRKLLENPLVVDGRAYVLVKDFQKHQVAFILPVVLIPATAHLVPLERQKSKASGRCSFITNGKSMGQSSNSSRNVDVTLDLDNIVDDLLVEASNLQEKKGSVVPLQHDAKLTYFTKPSPQSTMKLMDDFNSWLDTIIWNKIDEWKRTFIIESPFHLPEV